MPTSPNTPLILTTLQTMCQGLIVAGASAPFFAASSVGIGKFKDVTNILPCLEITADTDDTGRWTLGSGVVQGGKIDDSQEFLLEITLDMTQAPETPTTVETQLALIRDALTLTFNQSATLGLIGQVQYSGLVKGSGKRGYSFRNGDFRRVYVVKVRVRYEYIVVVQP